MDSFSLVFSYIKANKKWGSRYEKAVKMYKENIEYYKTQARVVKAIAHPARLFILERLRNKEYCVNSLTEELGYDTSTVSKHLSILKNVGLISDEKRGLNVFYKLRTPCVLDMLLCVNKTVRQVSERNLKYLEK